MYTAFLVTYNRCSNLPQVIEGILSQSSPPRQLIVIDNGSTDETKEFLKSVASEKIEYLNTGDNLGHGAGLAYGFKFYLESCYEEELIMLFEDDSVADSGLAEYMMSHYTENDYGLIALGGANLHLGWRREPELFSGFPVEVDSCLLDGCVFQSSLLKDVGVPVENWFMMYDDIEYSYRVKKHGFKLGAVKNLYHTIEHAGAKSSIWRHYYQARNHFHFIKKHPTLFNMSDFFLIEFKRIAGLLFSSSENRKKAWFRIKGLFDGLRNVHGRSVEPF